MTIEYNGIKVPEYLSKDFFQKALANGLNDPPIAIRHISITYGSQPGDNYCSEIYRVKINYSTKTKENQIVSLIVKSIPAADHNSVLTGNLDVYNKEALICDKIIPQLQSTMLQNTIFGPKCFITTENPLPTFVLEDMNVAGYFIADREAGLDEIHCKTVLTKLGKFHAASIVLLEKEPRYKAELKTGMFNPTAFDSPLFQNIFIGNTEVLIKTVEKWDGFKEIAKKMGNILKNFFEKVIKTIDTENDQVKVINHGDMWVNNILFKYDEKPNRHPIDAMFIDFQMCFYGSPGIDINYFFNTSVKLDVLKSKRDELISTYYNSLVGTLKELGHEKLPTLDTIKNEIKRKEFYGFIAAATILPLVTMDKKASKDSNLEAFLDEEQALKTRFAMFATERFQETFKYIIQRLDSLRELEV